MSYPNGALTDVCQLLMDDLGLTLEQIKHLAADLHGECENIADNRAEAAWLERQQPDDSSYRRNMNAAGRGHLLGG